MRCTLKAARGQKLDAARRGRAATVAPSRSRHPVALRLCSEAIAPAVHCVQRC